MRAKLSKIQIKIKYTEDSYHTKALMKTMAYLSLHSEITNVPKR